VKRIVLV